MHSTTYLHTQPGEQHLGQITTNYHRIYISLGLSLALGQQYACYDPRCRLILDEKIVANLDD